MLGMETVPSLVSMCGLQESRTLHQDGFLLQPVASAEDKGAFCVQFTEKRASTPELMVGR